MCDITLFIGNFNEKQQKKLLKNNANFVIKIIITHEYGGGRGSNRSVRIARYSFVQTHMQKVHKRLLYVGNYH